MADSNWRLTQVNWAYFTLDGGAMFGVVPRPIWSPLCPPNENNGIRLAMRSLILQRDNRVVLVDCGMWNYFPEKLHTKVYNVQQEDAATALPKAIGLGPEAVTDIIPTHLHFDHVGGFLHKSGEKLAPAFPNATVHVQQRQLEWAAKPSSKDRASYLTALIDAIAAWPKLKTHDGPWELDSEVRVEIADGHTPAMQIVVVDTGTNTVVHTADMIPTSFHIPIPYIMAYDTEPVVTGREKEALYARYPKALFFFAHDPEEPLWTLARTPRGGWTRGESMPVDSL